MKSVVFTRYGDTSDLDYRDVAQPVPADDEVLVCIHASSVNDWDWVLLRGKSPVNRLLFGLTKPRIKTLGIDIAGSVAALGRKVTRFEVGDEVWGDLSGRGWGGFAEYVCVSEAGLEPKPPSLSFAEAAATPQAGVLAIQSFLDKMDVRPGQHVLLNGAGGGSGTFAIQIAKRLGARVTAVDKRSKFDSMRALGADELIDYTEQDFTENLGAYDYILDFCGHHPLLHYRRALKKNGKYLLVGGSRGLILKMVLVAPFLSMAGARKLRIMPHEANKHLAELGDRLERSELEVVIDSTFPLEQVPQALERFGSGLANGKIVIAVRP
ncbi:MAG: zinc-binding dehydrogenase [Gammaproteobacteria bacterium]|jgi:NADPH:quinone reductase-like Zn-dependent oxidoreductase|nr:zinc-binding dehydrogenase [Gammaproteobacteria bacterium]